MCSWGPVFPRQRCAFCGGLSGYKKWPLSFASSSPDAAEFTEELDTEGQNQNRYSKGTMLTMDRKLVYWIFLFGCLHEASAQAKNASRLPSYSFYSKDQRMRNLTNVRVSCQFLFDNSDYLQDT